MATFEDGVDDASELLRQLDAAAQRDHEAALAKLGAAVDLLDAHLQASFSAADEGEGPETQRMQAELQQARAEYERMKAARGEARVAHRRTLGRLFEHLKQRWRHLHPAR